MGKKHDVTKEEAVEIVTIRKNINCGFNYKLVSCRGD